MKVFIGIIFMVIGLIQLIYGAIKEDSKTYSKIISGATCGVLVLGGLLIAFII